MTIGEYLRKNDIEVYRKLKKASRIKLGDRTERLMAHYSYKRIGGRIKQKR